MDIQPAEIGPVDEITIWRLTPESIVKSNVGAGAPLLKEAESVPPESEKSAMCPCEDVELLLTAWTIVR